MTPSLAHPSRPLLLAGMALLLFAPGLFVLEKTRQIPPLLAIAALGVLFAIAALVSGLGRLRKKPSGKSYGFAVGGSIAGLFALLFWIVMVPLLILFALPARQADPEDPLIEESRRQMRVIVRQIKSFHREQGRLPVKIEELVEKKYLQNRLLYDPRDRVKAVPSYRILGQDLPPPEQAATTPLLEGRWPDALGKRLLAFSDETIGETP